MGLSGLQIYKLMPKTNCRECGQATCMAFAMALASGKTSLDACPHASDAAKEALGAASEPPMRLVTIGQSNTVKAGGETVLYRHEKTFYNMAGLAIRVRDDLGAEELEARLAAIRELVFERIGIEMRVNLVAVDNVSGQEANFVQTVKAAQAAGLPLVLKTSDPAVAAAALEVVGSERPLIWGANKDNLAAMVDLAKKHQVPLALVAGSLEDLAQMSAQAEKDGHKDLVAVYAGSSILDTQQALVSMRRMALLKRFRPFGLPAGVEITGPEASTIAMHAGGFIAKYGSIIIVDSVDPAVIFPLVVLRQNIYTDPQKPIRVEATVYSIGEPDADAPLLVTTNFSLTYFSVINEIESSKVPAHLLTVDTDGLSVLTSWAAGKFGAEQIAEALSKHADGKVNHRKLIIPGAVAVLSGRLAEMSGWEIKVGPREAAALPNYLRSEEWAK